MCDPASPKDSASDITRAPSFSSEGEEAAPAAPRAPAAFPAPLALEGVKSKRRAVLAVSFGAGDAGAVAAAGLPASAAAAAGCVLSLGLGARASVAGLAAEDAEALCRRLALGDAARAPLRHEGLRVAALPGADAAAELRSACAAAPHLVVVRLAGVLPPRCGAVRAALREYRGALLIVEDGDGADAATDAGEEAAAVLRSLGVTSRWAADAGGALRAAAVPPAPATEIIGDLRLRDLEQDPAMAALVAEAQPLYDEYFHEDLLDDVRSRENARVAFLVRSGRDGAPPLFCGVLVYKLWGAPLRAMSVLRVAVPARLRTLGYGRQLMRWLMQKAVALPRHQCAKVTLCAMPEAIPFYDRLGFAPIPLDDLAPCSETEDAEEELPAPMPGALWMQYKCGRFVKPASKR